MRGERGFSLFGFSLLELVVVVCIVGTLAAMLSDRLLKLQVEAERASMEHIVGVLRSAVAMEFAARIAQGNEDRIGELVGTNPMDRLAETPASYLGAFPNPTPESVAGGSWYFDSNRQLLVYRVRYGKFFETSLDGPPRARFKLQWASADYNLSGNFEPRNDFLRGVTVSAIEEYRWLNPIDD